MGSEERSSQQSAASDEKKAIANSAYQTPRVLDLTGGYRSFAARSLGFSVLFCHFLQQDFGNPAATRCVACSADNTTSCGCFGEVLL
jgi:hypothetical protein